MRSYPWFVLSLSLLPASCSPSGSAGQGYGRQEAAGTICTTICEEPLFEEAVAIIKQYEGWHDERHYPYVGYGHRLLPGETLTAPVSPGQADSLLRADLLRKCSVFRRFGKDSLLLGVLAYNVGEYRLLGHGDRPKSRLIEKLEAGDRDVFSEYVSFRMYNGRVVPSLERRRRDEFELLFDKVHTPVQASSRDSCKYKNTGRYLID